MAKVSRSFCKIAAASLLASVMGCGEGGAEGALGNLSVLLEAEETITGGIAAGPGPEAIQDGWSVAFDKYLVVIGDVKIQLATDANVERTAEQLFAVDLTRVPESALPLWQIDDLSAERWAFGYALRSAGPDVTPHDSVSATDFAEMSENGWTYLIEARLENPTGEACPPASLAEPPAGAVPVRTDAEGNACYAHTELGFRLGVPVEVEFARCESDGLLGVAIPDGAAATVTATLHGDHMFFNGFPSEDEGGVTRLAQWVADSDLDLDGELTREELSSITLADLPALANYQFGGTAARLDTPWDYVIEQLRTQGHMNGEGECTPL